MAQYATELFAHFVYSPEMSYHELLDKEEELKIFFSRLVEDHSGDFLHFEADGDALCAQCVFTEYTEDRFHDFCDGLAPAMDGTVEARLLFVSKNLDFLHIFAVEKGTWTESVIHLPPAGIGRCLQRMDKK